MSFSVIYNNGAFHAVGEVDKKTLSIFKEDRWKVDPHKCKATTTSVLSAYRLRDHADETAKNIFARKFLSYSPWTGPLFTPSGLLDHQFPSAIFALRRNRSYLGLEPGLGKTPIAAVIAQTMNVRALYVCPPFLTLNTLEEFQKWAPGLDVGIIGARGDWDLPQVLIVPDSVIDDPSVRDYIRMFRPELIIGDEFHRYKTPTTARTKAMLGWRDQRTRRYHPGIVDGVNVKKVVAMSGTPMPNRPIELFPVLSKLAPELIEFKSMHNFGVEFCRAYEVTNQWTGQKYGWDYKGCNDEALKVLSSRMTTSDPLDSEGFMLRLRKDILNLPPLTQDIVVLSEDMPVKLKSMNASVLERYSPEDLMKEEIAVSRGQKKDDLQLATYRRLLGMCKARAASSYIKALLEDTEQNLLVFAYHKEVIAELMKHLGKYDPLVVTGEINSSKSARHKVVKEYQTNKKRRIFLGNIDAAGVGLTLTKAHWVGMVEWSWAPGVNRQAIDRAHRYTLEHPLHADYFAFRNSIDVNQYRTLERKSRSISIV